MEKLTFTEKEVSELVKNTVYACIKANIEWIKNETDIIDKDTKEVLHNAEINVRKNTKSLLKEYIAPLLEEKGMIYKFE